MPSTRQAALEPELLRKKKLVHHRRTVMRLAVLSGLPGILALLLFLWINDHSTKTVVTTLVFVFGAWGFLLLSLNESIFRPMQAASNMLSALREGDYSLKPRDVDEEDPLGQIMWEISQLTHTLREQRMGAVEATLLLQQVMEEIDVAVFAVTPDGTLSLVNKTGEELLGIPADSAVGKPVAELPKGIRQALDPDFRGDYIFPGRHGRWGMKRGTFREQGEPHSLLLFTDLSQRLREEERQAWKRLIRVIGHEINNSLAPIKSIAGSMVTLLRQDPLPEDWKEDVDDGLDVISTRVEALSRFVEDYARIARLPPPKKEKVAICELLDRVVALNRRKYDQVELARGENVQVEVDPDQIEQLLINITKNAVEAAQATGGKVEISCSLLPASLQISVRDEGLGIANPSNIFVPFFSTKPGGSGIGLTLSRQIAEAHEGSLELTNREDRPGAIATLTLPRT